METMYRMAAFMSSAFLILIAAACIAAPAPAAGEDKIACIRQQLSGDEAVVVYELTDTSVHITVIAQQSSHHTVCQVNRLFWRSMTLYRAKLRSAGLAGLSHHGGILYLYLMQPVMEFIAGMRRLIIVPDRHLTGLPFETFVRNDEGSKDTGGASSRYLIQDFEIVYRFSIDCFEKIGRVTSGGDPTTGEDDRYAIAGFAPDYGENAWLTPLPACQAELRKIGMLFRRQGLSTWLVEGEKVDKEIVRSLIRQGRIVHLAAHFIPVGSEGLAGGFVFHGYDPETGNPAGAEGMLTAEDIAGTGMDADLVVLNGCGTGAGAGGNANGSPPATMPQCWLNAGAHNIISTMWNVTDNLAGKFMVDFYRAWLSGKTYSEALRHVKLQWIACRETSLPTVWAPYLLTER